MDAIENNEIEIEVKTFKVYLECGKCLSANMVTTGKARPISPMEYEHRCQNENCDNTDWNTITYPCIITKEIKT